MGTIQTRKILHNPILYSEISLPEQQCLYSLENTALRLKESIWLTDFSVNIKKKTYLQTQVEELLADRDHLTSQGIYVILKGTLA
jgi:hypothetical protein